MEKKISLLEALTGFNYELSYLDGSKITIATAPQEIISHGQVKVVKNKGMPFYKDAFSHGNLYIKFNVEFPARGQLKNEQIEALKTILPGPKQSVLDKKKNYELLEDFDEHETNPHEEGGRNKGDDEEDEEMSHGGQRVQCAQS